MVKMGTTPLSGVTESENVSDDGLDDVERSDDQSTNDNTDLQPDDLLRKSSRPLRNSSRER